MNQKNIGTQSNVRAPIKKWVLVCHYCERSGHIRPRCFQYLADLRKISEKKQYGTKTTKKACRRKGDVHSYVAYTSLKVSEKDDWYFDSG